MGTLKVSLLIVTGLAALGGGAALVREGGLDRLGALVETAQTPAPAEPPVQTGPAARSPSEPGDATPQPDDAAPGPAPPAIDVVRLQPDGAALVSGSGEPGATVEILVDGAPVWSGSADPRGEFVAFVDLPASAVARTISLRSDDGDGRSQSSEASIVLAPSPEAPETSVAEAPGTVGIAAAPDQNVSEELADLTAPALESDPEGVRPLAPTPVDPDQGIALDTVRYGAEGEVILAGRSDAGESDLSIYLDGQIAAQARTTGQGDWQAVLADVPSGLYRLRADLTDGQGRVAGRVDLPFRRESPAAIEAARVAASDADQSAALLTVQPGFSLWAIARDRYGDGFQYVAVYEANAEAIADPDLIYPGQVLTLPAGPVVPTD
ncbi:MAG: Ig-like domain-containing protein [Rhodobacteraceae bacterium]|nr:Ig-like domain-containing protein [Paracoccaceae bacterium]